MKGAIHATSQAVGTHIGSTRIGSAIKLTLPHLLLLSLFATKVVLASDCLQSASEFVTAAVLRAQPTTDSARVGSLKSGQTLPLVHAETGWYETRQDNGAPAYVSKRWTRIATCEAPNPISILSTSTSPPVPLLAKAHSVD